VASRIPISGLPDLGRNKQPEGCRVPLMAIATGEVGKGMVLAAAYLVAMNPILADALADKIADAVIAKLDVREKKDG